MLGHLVYLLTFLPNNCGAEMFLYSAILQTIIILLFNLSIYLLTLPSINLIKVVKITPQVEWLWQKS